MSAPLTHMASHGFWMLLGTVALVLLVLGLIRALFPDFSNTDANTGPGSVQHGRRRPNAATESPASHMGAEPPPGRRG